MKRKPPRRHEDRHFTQQPITATIPLRIDHKTVLYRRADEDPEEVKARYLRNREEYTHMQMHHSGKMWNTKVTE